MKNHRIFTDSVFSGTWIRTILLCVFAFISFYADSHGQIGPDPDPLASVPCVTDCTQAT